MDKSKITVEAVVNVPIEKAWDVWVLPEHIKNWAFASDDWEARAVTNDIRTDGRFSTLMAAKDNSAQFDFCGTYTNVEDQSRIEYLMDGEDKRTVAITFEQTEGGTKIAETFDPEEINSRELQVEGWQAILNNYKKYAESLT